MNACRKYCGQGRIPCPSPWECNTRRVEPSLFVSSTRDGGERVNVEHEPRARVVIQPATLRQQIAVFFRGGK
jgi:hypothetical protein